MVDKGNPPMQSEAKEFEIQIIDVNNNAPEITYPTDEIRIYKVTFNFFFY